VKVVKAKSAKLLWCARTHAREGWEKTKKTHCISWCIFATICCTGKELPSAS